MRHLSRLGSSSARLIFAALALLVGLIHPAYPGPPTQIAPSSAIQPVIPDIQPATVICGHLVAHHALGPPSEVFIVVVLRGHPHSAAVTLYAYCDGEPVNRWDPTGLDYVNTSGDHAYWIIENQGWLYHADVRTVYLGKVSNGQITLTGDMGGGSIGLDEAKEIASRFWFNNNDMSAWQKNTQDAAIRLSLGQGKSGNLGMSLADNQEMYTFAAAEGIGQGARNLAEPVAILADGATNTAAVVSGYDIGTSLSQASDPGGLMDQIDTVMELSSEEGRGGLGQYLNGIGHVAAVNSGYNNLSDAISGEGIAWDELGGIAGIDELSTGERWMRGTVGTFQAAGTAVSVFGGARIAAPRIESAYRWAKSWEIVYTPGPSPRISTPARFGGSSWGGGSWKLQRIDVPFKPRLTVNPERIPGSNAKPGKTPLPGDEAEVYKNAIPDENGRHWYGLNAKGDVYLYNNSNNGTAHFSGSTASERGLSIPPYVRKRLEALRKKLGL